MAKNYWLLKSEGDCYSIDDLRKDKKTSWTGIRNYQSRNFMMKDMKVGDTVLFYHSGGDAQNPTGVYGLASVCSPAHVDETQFDITGCPPYPRGKADGVFSGQHQGCYFGSGVGSADTSSRLSSSRQSREGFTASNKTDDHFDPKSTKEKPIWYCVDIKFLNKFKNPITLAQIKFDPKLEGMRVREVGSRLSVQPVSVKHGEYIVKLAGVK